VISEGSCDAGDGNNDAENSVYKINYLFYNTLKWKTVILKCNNSLLQFTTLLFSLHQISQPLMSTRDESQKQPQTLNGILYFRYNTRFVMVEYWP